MITEENKKLAQWAMDYALKNGCQAAKLTLYTNSNSSFELRNGKIDRLQQATENGLSLNLYVDGRYGYVSTNRLDKKELETLIKNGIDSTRYLAVDEARVLPDPSRYYKGGLPDLQLFDKKLYAISPDDKLDLAKAAAEEAMGKDERIISVDTAYGDGEGSSYRLISNGFEGESQSTWFSLSAMVSIKGEGEARPQGSWYDSSLFYDKLKKQGLGTTALERVLRRLGQKKAKSGKYTMVVEQQRTGQLLGPMLNALYGSSLQQKDSFLLDKLGAKVASGLFTLRKAKGKDASWEDAKAILSAEMGFWTELPLTWEQERTLRDEFETSFKKNKVVFEESLYAKTEPLAAAAKNIMSQIAHLGWTTGGHSAEYVPVYAVGAGSKLFSGKMDNTDIPKRIAEAAGY